LTVEIGATKLIEKIEPTRQVRFVKLGLRSSGNHWVVALFWWLHDRMRYINPTWNIF